MSGVHTLLVFYWYKKKRVGIQFTWDLSFSLRMQRYEELSKIGEGSSDGNTIHNQAGMVTYFRLATRWPVLFVIINLIM